MRQTMSEVGTVAVDTRDGDDEKQNESEGQEVGEDET